jgi:hypothetical protein
MESSSLGRTAIKWFVVGASVSAGAIVFAVFAILVLDPLFNVITEKRKGAEFTPNTGQLVVESLEPLSITKEAGVRAVIRNNGTLKTRPDSVTLRISHGPKTLFDCDVHANLFISPGESVTEQFLCTAVERASVPADAKYTLQIKGTWNSI